MHIYEKAIQFLLHEHVRRGDAHSVAKAEQHLAAIAAWHPFEEPTPVITPGAEEESAQKATAEALAALRAKSEALRGHAALNAILATVGGVSIPMQSEEAPDAQSIVSAIASDAPGKVIVMPPPAAEDEPVQLPAALDPHNAAVQTIR